MESVPGRVGMISAAMNLAASGRLILFGAPYPLRAGVTYSSITFLSTGAANGPTNQWFTIVGKSDLLTKRSTVNDTTTAWGSNAYKTLALSSSYTPASDIDVYIGIVVTVTTTMPTLRMGETWLSAVSDAPTLVGASTSSLTTPVSDGTSVATPSAYVDGYPWFAIS
jgi:hypothetical protein